jgi:farnesyl-diphosphate farnesyltransferase
MRGVRLGGRRLAVRRRVRPPTPPDLRRIDELLEAVSRSFYFSLRVLPKAVRAQLSIAYLLGRAADTIADTEAVPVARRLDLLAGLRDAVGGGQRAKSLASEVRGELLAGAGAPAERRLLGDLDLCLDALAGWGPEDRARTAGVLVELCAGMERDLRRFPPMTDGRPRALSSLEELDQHLFSAAGCVGEYWTRTVAAHIAAAQGLAAPALLARGVRLGKALQMINVLRDLPEDLAAGRCYVPLPLLERHGLRPEELALAAPGRVRPLLDELLRIALSHLDAAFPYVLATPASAPRLRLACVWPLWIGLGTLRRAGEVTAPLAEGWSLKIPRRALYALLAEAALVVTVDPLLRRAHARRRAQAAIGLGSEAPAGLGADVNAAARRGDEELVCR